MKNQLDFCKFFQDIEANPTAIVPRLTVRQFYQAKEHLAGCDACYNRVERVNARAPKQEYPNGGNN